MEFKEFSNPESEDYDITSSLSYGDNSNSSYNQYSEQLMDLIGLLEDVLQKKNYKNNMVSVCVNI